MWTSLDLGRPAWILSDALNCLQKRLDVEKNDIDPYGPKQGGSADGDVSTGNFVLADFMVRS